MSSLYRPLPHLNPIFNSEYSDTLAPAAHHHLQGLQLTMSTAARRRLMRDFKVRHPCSRLQLHASYDMLGCLVNGVVLTVNDIADADRPSRWCFCISYCRQCHDLVRPARSPPHATPIAAFVLRTTM
jgi:hypothetical protein